MPAKLFITATDTDAGKTYISTMLLQGLKNRQQKAVAIKPIAAGVDQTGKNGDALLLQQHSGIALPYEWINPLCFAEPVAPHLAALQLGQQIDESVLDRQLQQVSALAADQVLIEGAGGWLLPISAQRYLADWVADNKLAVCVVVAIKLGCLNHAILTIREIEYSGLTVAGWVANCTLPDMPLQAENIADLKQRIEAPCWGVIPYKPSAEQYRQLSDQLVQHLLLAR